MPLSQPRTDALVDRAVAGDPAAIASLVQAHGPLVYSLSRRLTPDADDAYQEVWEKVLKALPRFDPGGSASIRTWIVTITHRHLVDRHRRRQVRGEIVPLTGLAAHQEAPGVALDRGRRQARLERALRTLPEPQRRVVVLHHVQGLSLQDIAATERVAVGTLKSRLHRGRAALARRLGATP